MSYDVLNGLDLSSQLGPQQRGPVAPAPVDGNFYEFYVEAVYQPYKSELANRPIYEDQVFLRIITGASNGKNIRCRPAVDADKMRWPTQWAQFEAGQTQCGVGLPLSEWAPLSRSQVLELKANQVHTVEQLAEIPDSGLDRLGMGARDLREKAKRFVAQAAGNAPIEALARENKDLREEVEALRVQIAEVLKSTKFKD